MVRGSLVGFGLRLGLGLAWAVACAGCRGGSADDAPPCGAVATRFLDLANHDLAQAQARVDEPARRAVVDQLPAMRDALAQACVDGRWRPAVRTCLVQATDHVGFEACERQLTDDQRRDLDRANRGSSAPAAPAP
jgi:hypothetical protein